MLADYATNTLNNLMENEGHDGALDCRCTILALPNELLLFIARHLDGLDIVSFSLSCKRFSNVCLERRQLCLEGNPHDGIPIGMPPKLMARFLKHSVDPAVLTECNFNNCYWIPGKLLKNFIVKCPNLESLFVAETGVTVNHLMSHILPVCRKITALSLTMSRGDWRHARRHVTEVDMWPRSDRIKRSTKPGDPRNPHTIQRMIAFYQSCKVLKVLKDLTIVLKGSMENFIFFSVNCPNVENLTVVRAKEGGPRYFKPNSSGCKLIGSTFYRARTIVFAGTLFPRDCYTEIEFGKKLETYWSTALDFPYKSNRNVKYSALSWGVPEDYLYPSAPWEGYRKLSRTRDVSMLESFREPTPFFMRELLVTPQLKLASCFFERNEFPAFCQNHPLLEVLRLRSGQEWFPGYGSWIPGSWERLSNLRVLSLEPNLIVGTAGEEKSSPDWSSNHSLLGLILQDCPSIEELEIGYFPDSRSNDLVEMSSEELSVIGQCKSLKKLTLAHLHISDGRFLATILERCPLLESLRLRDLGSALSCCYAKDLCAALPLAKSLKTFCIFQSEFDQMSDLLDSLESCQSLIQLSLVTPCSSFPPVWTAENFSKRLLRFCQRLNRLVALFCVMKVPNSHRLQASKLLNRVVARKRPSFRVDIQRGGADPLRLDYESKILPLVHKQILVHFNSQVGIFPYGYKSFLF